MIARISESIPLTVPKCLWSFISNHPDLKTLFSVATKVKYLPLRSSSLGRDGYSESDKNIDKSFDPFKTPISRTGFLDFANPWKKFIFTNFAPSRESGLWLTDFFCN